MDAVRETEATHAEIRKMLSRLHGYVDAATLQIRVRDLQLEVVQLRQQRQQAKSNFDFTVSALNAELCAMNLELQRALAALASRDRQVARLQAVVQVQAAELQRRI